MSSARQMRETVRGAAVLGATIFSGYLLALFVLRTQYQIVVALLLSVSVAMTLMPRQRWPKILAFVFLFAGVFGIGSIAAAAARSFIDVAPIASRLEHLSTLAVWSCVFLAVWVGWWFRDKRRVR